MTIEAEINLPIPTGNCRLTIGAGKCDGCKRNGGGMLQADFDVDLTNEEKLPILLCGNCLMIGMIAKVEHFQQEEAKVDN